MTVTYGFYNSLDGDRKYNTTDISSIFDGIINDGIFMSVGTSFMVKAAEGMGVNVGIGKAWFNHTWTKNDSILPLTLDQSEVVLNRIDAVVLDINGHIDSRENTIKIIKGTPGTVPQPPVLVRSLYHNQYALAHIYVGRGVTSVTQSDITNKVGTGDAPFVTGILDTIDTTDLVAQWESQYRDWTNLKQNEFDSWATLKQEDYNTWTEDKKFAYDTWVNTKQAEYDLWFDLVKDVLDENAAGNLLNMINATNVEVGTLSTSFSEHLEETASLTKLGHIKGNTDVDGKLKADSVNLTDISNNFTNKNVEGAMSELFTNVGNGKQLVGNAITGVDDSVVVPTNPSFQDLANAVGGISTKVETKLSDFASSLFYKTVDKRGNQYVVYGPNTEVRIYDKYNNLTYRSAPIYSYHYSLFSYESGYVIMNSKGFIHYDYDGNILLNRNNMTLPANRKSVIYSEKFDRYVICFDEGYLQMVDSNGTVLHQTSQSSVITDPSYGFLNLNNIALHNSRNIYNNKYSISNFENGTISIRSIDPFNRMAVNTYYGI